MRARGVVKKGGWSCENFVYAEYDWVGVDSGWLGLSAVAVLEMTPEEIDRLWYKAVDKAIQAGEDFIRYRFAALIIAAEREKLQRDGWRQCATGQRTTQYCGLLRQAVEAEREACWQACKDVAAQEREDENTMRKMSWAEECMIAIRARGDVPESR